MKSRWLGVALLAAGLGVGNAHGQSPEGYAPTPVGAARIPEPTPICQPLPPMMQGPLNPLTAPPGPPDCLSLPAGHSSAFQCEDYVRDNHCFLHLGAVGLQRQDMGHLGIAFLDTQSNGLDTGIVPRGLGPLVVDLHDVGEHMLWGLTATVGYFKENQGVELSGFWLPSDQRVTKTYFIPGSLDALFFNPLVGFEGDNGLWLQADLMSIQRQTNLGSAEFNYRYTDKAVTEAECTLGVRYIYFKERLNVFTDDDFTIKNAFGQSDPIRQANYQTQAQNQLVGPQIGFEYGRAWKFLSAGITAKAAGAVDFTNIHHRLYRGDGFKGFDVQRNDINYQSQIYDGSAFVEFHFTEKCRLRGAYNMLWLVDITNAQDQFNFNLANPQGIYNRRGSVFFAGPSVEMEFLF